MPHALKTAAFSFVTTCVVLAIVYRVPQIKKLVTGAA